MSQSRDGPKPSFRKRRVNPTPSKRLSKNTISSASTSPRILWNNPAESINRTTHRTALPTNYTKADNKTSRPKSCTICSVAYTVHIKVASIDTFSRQRDTPRTNLTNPTTMKDPLNKSSGTVGFNIIHSELGIQ